MSVVYLTFAAFVTLKIPKLLQCFTAAKKSGLTLNDKIRAFIEEHQHRPLPPRESVLKPEILIPCFNHGRFLNNMIEPIANAGVPITVIDDHSDEPNRELIEKAGRRFGLKVLRNASNLKQHGSLNKAIQDSTNNLFMVANADDFLMPSWIPYAMAQFRQQEIALLGGLHIDFLNHFAQSEESLSRMIGSMSFRPDTAPAIYDQSQALHFYHDNSIDMTMTGCTFLRSAWDFVGGFFPLEKRVSIHDDRDFQMRVCAFFNVGISSELSAFWRMNTSTGMGSK